MSSFVRREFELVSPIASYVVHLISRIGSLVFFVVRVYALHPSQPGNHIISFYESEPGLSNKGIDIGPVKQKKNVR